MLLIYNEEFFFVIAKSTLFYCTLYLHIKIYLPFITLYVIKICAILFAGDVNANPRPQSNEPANATLR